MKHQCNILLTDKKFTEVIKIRITKHLGYTYMAIATKILTLSEMINDEI